MADTLDSTGKYVPKDLQISAQPDSVDKNKFRVSATGLKIDTNYVFQFQYVFPDGEVSEWSPGYTLNTSGESAPGVPTGTIVPSTFISSIPVELPTFPSGAKKVDVIITNGIFNTGKIAYTFLSAGKTTISAPAGTYIVQLRATSISGVTSTVGTTHSITVSDSTVSADPSVTPSTPTVSSVLGAIQLSWNGKTSSGGDQPNGFKAAKVYVGTTSGFTPVDTGNSGANQVDVLSFGNGQNTLNISVGTIVNGTAMTYGVDYYVKIATTNGTDTSTPVAASGNPVRIGQVSNGDIITIAADKITTGTISSQTITVGAPSGKRVELRGSGNPIEIFGTGGTSLLAYNAGSNKLTITGDGSFSGDISAASGTFSGNLSSSNGQFSVISGSITALSGSIGNWRINEQALKSSEVAFPKIELDPISPKIEIRQSASDSSESGIKVIKIDPTDGLRIGTTSNFKFRVDMDGNMTASDAIFNSGTFNGNITSTATITGGSLVGATIYTSSGSYGITITGGTGTSDSIYFNNTVGTAEISVASSGNGFQFLPPGGTAGSSGLTLYGTGAGGVPNTIIARNPVRVWADDPNLVNNTTASITSAKGIRVAHFAVTTGSYIGTGSPFFNGDIHLQYTP